MEIKYINLTSFFKETLSELQCDYETKAYIVGVFAKNKSSEYDLSKDSLTLTYSQAKNNRDFLLFQTLADYLFFMNTMYPDALNNASRDYYYSLARLSYYNCYKIVHSWNIYERLAENFIILSDKSRDLIVSKSINTI